MLKLKKNLKKHIFLIEKTYYQKRTSDPCGAK
jgi:hypothetical protein